MRRTRVLPRRFEHVWKIALAGLVIAAAAGLARGPRPVPGAGQEPSPVGEFDRDFQPRKGKGQPEGIREGWKEKSEKAFADGVIRAPASGPGGNHAQLNFETMDPA